MAACLSFHSHCTHYITSAFIRCVSRLLYRLQSIIIITNATSVFRCTQSLSLGLMIKIGVSIGGVATSACGLTVAPSLKSCSILNRRKFPPAEAALLLGGRCTIAVLTNNLYICVQNSSLYTS